jgi:hypothetical protein
MRRQAGTAALRWTSAPWENEVRTCQLRLRRERRTGWSSHLLFLVLAFHAIYAQTQVELEPALNASRKRVEIARTSVRPLIDGKLDDAIWSSATLVSDMHQYLPRDQGAPSERSEFYLAYDERFLYVGARLYDSQPEAISARQLLQGQNLGFDDTFEFIIDTFNNGRTGYYFQVNPNGIRNEGVYENPNQLNSDWTGIWEVESRIDDDGWTAEVAIPFNTLNFDPQAQEWGFTIARRIARKKEEIAWTSFNRRVNPSTTGILHGIRDIRQGAGLDIIPSLVTGFSRDHVQDLSTEQFEPSLNMFYKITPNLTGALTLNTDFSATEVDNRQVNLSRFSLFFPEKRDFFLQDVDIFSFGGRAGAGFGNNRNATPFYSRRIGLSASGSPVDIDVGLKLTGRIGPLSMGLLGVQQGDEATLDGQQLWVGRLSLNVMSESSVGMIFTQGDPVREADNGLLGVDFRYQNTRYSDRYSIRGNAWFQQTRSDDVSGDSGALGVSANIGTQGTGFGAYLGYEQVGENYFPALGFANRRGVKVYSGRGRYRYFLDRHPLLRTVSSVVDVEQFRSSATGLVQSESVSWRMLEFQTHLGSVASMAMTRSREGLERDFEIRPGHVIPAGHYRFADAEIEVGLSDIYSFAPQITVSSGQFYNGSRQRWRYNMQWRPDVHFALDFGYDFQSIELPTGDFDVKLVNLNASYAFNAKWSLVNLVQYDNSSESVGLNSRLRWNPRAGEDLYVILNHQFGAEGVFSGLSREQAQISIKYSRTLRF